MKTRVHDRISVVANDVISLWVYPRRKIIHHVMAAYCHGDRFRDALSRGTEAMLRHQATKWLSDDRANGALLAEDGRWAMTIWFPRARAAGLQHWSVVQPAKIIGQMNMTRFVRGSAMQGVNTRMFSDPDEAFTWLDIAG